MFQGSGEKDLFGQPEAVDKKTRKKTGFILPEIKKSITLSYENIIFLSIGFVMSCIIFFSLGVEKGRKDFYKQQATSNKRQEIIEEKIAPDTEAEVPVRSAYIIQLAAFREKNSAEDEQGRLRKEGYNAAVKKSGIYYQVYIGGFDTKKDAEVLLTKLKKKYNDCYIIKY